MPRERPGKSLWDIFVCHAREDKPDFVEPLVAALEERGLAVWFDRFEVRLGDDVRAKIDEGLLGSRFGVVVLSPSFFKYWPEAELGALFALESSDDEKRILPVLRELSWRAGLDLSEVCRKAGPGDPLRGPVEARPGVDRGAATPSATISARWQARCSKRSG